ncbi:hypothetical protein [Chryseobacterium sp. Alg-005]|uniref:hypothetical protein n=1 Tax=Chryseobacterium sp. Alg-005 TaxID=3159516 RepID=UPI0036F1C12F
MAKILLTILPLYFSFLSGLLFAQTGNVGINTTNPTNTLHIVSGADPLRLEGLQPGNSGNNILTVDGNGVVKQNASVVGLQNGSYFAQGNNLVSIPAGQALPIDGVTITFTPTVNVNAMVTVSALPLPSAAGSNVQGSIDLLQNGAKISSQYYSSWDGQNLNRLGNYSTTTRLVPLTAGTAYTFSVQAKSWIGTTVFNKDPTVAPTYLNATASDSNSMKTTMTIVLFSR